MKLSLAKGFALAPLFVAASAHAGIIAIEPDDYAPGTVIAPTEYASVSYINHDAGDDFFTYRAVIAAVDPSCSLYPVCYAPTGRNVMSDGTLVNGVLQPHGTGELINMLWGLPPDEQGTAKLTPERIALMKSFYGLRVDFATPTDFISADFYNPTDPVWIYAFSADGTFLSLTQGNGEGGSGAVRREIGPDCTLSYACYTWEQTAVVQHSSADISYVIMGSYSSVAFPDAIRFSVPEPSGLALCAAGLLGLGLMRRRKVRAMPAMISFTARLHSDVAHPRAGIPSNCY